MKFLLTVAALTGAALTGLVTAQFAQLDLSKYNLSDCTKAYLPYIARAMTGIEVNEERKYAYCVVDTHNDTFFDYKCLCKGGDGEGSAIIDMARIAGHVGYECGWDYTFDVVFPETRNFCRTLLNEDLVTATTRRRRALKQPLPQPNIGLVAAEELPDFSNEGPVTATTHWALKEPPPQPNIDLVATEKLPEFSNEGLATATIDLVAAPELPDFSNLPWCTEDALGLAGRILTDFDGYYGTCLIPTPKGDMHDYKCLCKGGDGKGSALMSIMLESGLVTLQCGWDYTFDVMFPAIRKFCEQLEEA